MVDETIPLWAYGMGVEIANLVIKRYSTSTKKGITLVFPATVTVIMFAKHTMREIAMSDNLERA